ncbi:MAG: FAD-dependent oxidoreductase [Gammaproteobacteria bacterium]|nr:FAD-dependent oxidoreductase [Gammaproteobacteria bacterium]
MRHRTLFLLATWLLGACATDSSGPDTDVVVIGAGIAGLSAALEAGQTGARVVVLDINSVGGGHAVMAGGLFMVDTPLQQARGIEDSVDLAVADMLAWGEDADAEWVRRYAAASRPEVHDWLAGLGVEFTLLLPAPGETSVPRFHFARGAAVNVVVPIMKATLALENVEFRFNTAATGLARDARGNWRVVTRDQRSDATGTITAGSVIVATGGFEGNLDRVRANWHADVDMPARLLNGAGRFATGSGLDLGAATGAAMSRLDHQTIFVTGFPDPRDPSGEHGLLAQNPIAIYVNREGQRFMNEAVARKTLEQTVLAMPEQAYWLIFDATGRKRLMVRGAPWLNRNTIEQEILGNADVVSRAETLADLATAAGLPPDTLGQTVARYNEHIEAGEDADFGRFGAGDKLPKPISEPPFYAWRLYPMTRKSMGGLVIDHDTAVLDPNGEPIPGLFAAGEVTGVAGINGSYGGSGTFLGPAVLTGRIAGRSAAALRASQPMPSSERPDATATSPREIELMQTAALKALLAKSRDGYWHFEHSHKLVLERGQDCSDCHDSQRPQRRLQSRAELLAQLDVCTECH